MYRGSMINRPARRLCRDTLVGRSTRASLDGTPWSHRPRLRALRRPQEARTQQPVRIPYQFEAHERTPSLYSPPPRSRKPLRGHTRKAHNKGRPGYLLFGVFKIRFRGRGLTRGVAPLGPPGGLAKTSFAGGTLGGQAIKRRATDMNTR